MNSCIYRGEVFHKRFTPNEHAFHYQLDYAYLDLDEMDETFESSRFWSLNRSNLVSFKRNDYLPGEHHDLRDEVKARIATLGGNNFEGKIYVLTTLRALGYCMNPISLFYCFNGKEPSDPNSSEEGIEAGQLQYVLAEVHNTPWDERHTYLLEGPDFTARTLKTFHVSPFMPMHTHYEWQISVPTERLAVGINVSEQGQPLFTASMRLQRQPITSRTAAGLALQQSRQAFKTMSAIYLQAVKLWLKKTPIYPHPNKNKLQETNS